MVLKLFKLGEEKGKNNWSIWLIVPC
jgi:hypothetical protein